MFFIAIRFFASKYKPYNSEVIAFKSIRKTEVGQYVMWTWNLHRVNREKKLQSINNLSKRAIRTGKKDRRSK